MAQLPELLEKELSLRPRRWLVTGAAGFIGSSLVEQLLRCGQYVVGLDNFETGKQANLDDVKRIVGKEPWSRFSFIQGDICDVEIARRACKGSEIVLHQAALGSVPRSIDEPERSHESNVTGFLAMLIAARDTGVKRFVYASSSAVYGDSDELPKHEERIGEPLSPYAATKRIDEVYASALSRVYAIETIGLRYFNVFGPRQDPHGAYAAVIPRWIDECVRGLACKINGSAEISRDFCHVLNVVQANLLAGIITDSAAVNQVYNIALGDRTTLVELHRAIQSAVSSLAPKVQQQEALIGPPRAGDVMHSHADVSKARKLLGYVPSITLAQSMPEVVKWYFENPAR